MEFYSTAAVFIPAGELQRHIRIDNLPDWCGSIHRVLTSDNERGEVESVWGDVRIRREVISDGVRFTLPASHEALQWTITAGQGAKVNIHASVNCQSLPEGAERQLADCIENWRKGIEAWPERIAAERKKPAGECVPSYGGFG
jgi:hypothetical protein